MNALGKNSVHGPCLAAGLGLALLFHLVSWGGLAGFASSLDFNQALFEDFSGPYFEQGRAWLEGDLRPVKGFLYSPFFAVWMAVLAAAGHSSATLVWLVCLLVSGGILIALGLWARRDSKLAALGASSSFAFGLFSGASLPFLHGLHWGQVSAPLTAMMICGAWAVARRRAILGGALVGLAGAIKGYPLLLVLLFLARRDWRASSAAGASMLFLGLLVPSLAIGPAATWEFYSVVAANLIQLRASEWGDAAASQFLGAVLERVCGENLPAWVARWGSLLAAFCVMVWVLRDLSRDKTGGGSLHRAVAVSLCALPLWLQPAWPHYLVWLPFAQALAWGEGQCFGVLLRRACVFVSAGASSAFAFQWAGNYEAFYGAGFLCLASLVLIPPLLFSRP